MTKYEGVPDDLQEYVDEAMFAPYPRPTPRTWLGRLFLRLAYVDPNRERS